MSFVDIGLRIEFQTLVDDYISSVDENEKANYDACRAFTKDPQAALADDIQDALTNSKFHEYEARKNLFQFILDYKDCITFNDPPDASPGAGS